MEYAYVLAVGEAVGPLQKLARALVRSVGAAATLVAYSIRVMLAHVRMLFDGCTKDVAKFGKCDASKECATRPGFILEISHIIDPSAEGGFTRAGRHRRTPRPMARFREEPSVDPFPDEDDVESISSDDDQIIDYHHEKGNVFKLLADGRRLVASSYVQGETGLAIAKWGDGSMRQTLQPNANIQDDGSLSAHRLRARAKPYPKPLPRPH
eukprot:910260-Pyramimonas_sp.AAC.1